MPLPRTISTGRALLAGRNPFAYTNKVRALGPIAYWSLADAGGTTAIDESGNSRHGAYSGVTLGAPGIGDGRTAARFNGTSSFVDIFTAIGAIIPYDEGSLSIWVRDTALDATTRQAIGWRITTGDIRCQMIQASDRKPAFKRLNSIKDASDLTANWTHFGATWSVAGNFLKFYRSGALISTASPEGTLSGAITSDWCNIGCITPGAQHWGGDIAHAAVFNTPLTGAQIASLAVVS